MSPQPNDDTRMAQFLADEVGQTRYADMLLERARAAADGRPQLNASGNAYNVAFGRHKVVISHHHLKDWPPLIVAPQDFIAGLEQWRDRLGSS